MKDWEQVCPNCNGTGMEKIGFVPIKYGTCMACDGTGEFVEFLYLLMSGQIRREGTGWIPDVEFEGFPR